ncbi:membrane protein multiple antibiotic resistance (MarC)-like protein [Shewanella putrefaciens]|nr:membrane protein multiple antibiotic resistance (MarC)-like protein [Shewanella putrefaciens]
MAGPSILAALILLAHTDGSRMGDWTIALVSAWAASAVILMFYKLFTRMLGEKGLTAVERLMGMVLVMISVQMFLDGVSNYMKTTG